MFSDAGLVSKFSWVDGFNIVVARLMFPKIRVKLREQSQELRFIIEKYLENKQYVYYFEVAVCIVWKEEEPSV